MHTMEIAREPATRPGYNSYSVGGSKFDVPEQYSLIKPIGQGAYGIVCSADNSTTNRQVAIKKICKAFDCITDAVRTLREIKLLRHFNHENIINIEDIFKPIEYDGEGFQDVYIVNDLMETDLHQIIASSQPLTDEHVQYFLYQILRGLKYIHSAGVLHRDLKPSNLLLNGNCDLKICDFGLARVYDPTAKHEAFITQYVATRWYRAPEIILSWKQYTKAIDVWSAGCIFAELLQRQPLFPGKDYIHQVELIIKFVGTPTEADVSDIKSDKARRYLRSLPVQRATNLTTQFPKASEQALDLLKQMLAFNPRDRISVEDALAHPFLESLHDPRDEPVSSKPFDFEWETATPLTLDFIKALVFKEIIDCHPEAYNDIPNPLADKSHPQYEDIRKTLSATGKQLSVFDEVEQAMNPSPVNDRDQLDNSSSTSSLSSGRDAAISAASVDEGFLSTSSMGSMRMVQKSMSQPHQSDDDVRRMQELYAAQQREREKAKQQHQESLRMEERRRLQQQQLYAMQLIKQQQQQQRQSIQHRQQQQWEMQHGPQDLDSALGYTNIEAQMQGMQLAQQQQQQRQSYDPAMIAAQNAANAQRRQAQAEAEAAQIQRQNQALALRQAQQLQQLQQGMQQQQQQQQLSSWQRQQMMLSHEQAQQGQAGNLSADEIAALEALMGQR